MPGDMEGRRTEILTAQILSLEQQAAGLHLDEDDHTIYLKRGREVLTRWSAIGASKQSIRDDILQTASDLSSTVEM